MSSNTNRNLLFVGIGAALLFISSKASAASSTVFNSLVPSYGATKVNMLYGAYNALRRIGLSGLKLKLATSQAMYETGMFSTTSIAAYQDNNYTGILWINNPSVQKNATKGQPADSPGHYWAHFTTVDDWAVDFYRILNLPSYRPIQNATDPISFAHLLKLNGYYTGSETTYAAGVNYYFGVLSSVGL